MLVGLTADSHLDYRLGHRADERGINLRSRDFERGLAQVVDGFIRSKVNVAVFAGDLFDNAKPSERARQFLVSELRRLQRELPPVRIIALRGNHDAAMSFVDATAIGTASLALDGMDVVDAYEVATIEHDGVVFTCVPWMRSDADFVSAVASLETDPSKHNLLIAHCGMAELAEYAERRPGSQTLLRSEVPTERFDWIFSGHFHGHRTIEELRWTFIGSSERKSVTEAGQNKGFLTYDTDTRAISFHPIATRAWYDLPALDASAWDGQRVLREIEGLAAGLPDWADALVRVRLNHLAPDVYATLDTAAIKRVAAGAFFCNVEYRVDDPRFAEIESATERSEGGPLIDDIDIEWDRISKTLIGRSPEEVEAVARLGLAALRGDSIEQALLEPAAEPSSEGVVEPVAA